MTRRFRYTTVKYLVTWCYDSKVCTIVSLVTTLNTVTEKLSMIHTVLMSEAQYSGTESNNSFIYHSLVFYFVPYLIWFFLSFYFLSLSYSLISVFSQFLSFFLQSSFLLSLIICFLYTWYIGRFITERQLFRFEVYLQTEK